MTIQDYSTSRNQNIAKRNKATNTQHRTRTNWHDSTDHNTDTHKVLQIQDMQQITGSSTQKANLSDYTGNTERHSSHHQEHSAQSQKNNLRTTGEQPSDSRMVQRTRLRTIIKQWKCHTKHNSKCGKEKQHSGLRKARHCQRHYSNSLPQRHSQRAHHRRSHHK